MKRGYLWLLVTATVILTCWCAYVWNNNTYMEHKSVPVTYIDKYVTESCVKSHCRDRYMGWFRTDDGLVFDRHINDYMYKQMHLGEKFNLTLRPFDMHQTPLNNFYWFFGPIIILGLTGFFWLCTTLELAHLWIKRKKQLRV